MKAKPKRTLTEVEWRLVFLARCKSKRGQSLTDEERILVDTAWEVDRARYCGMDGDVFDATVPFGSSAKWGDR